MNNIINSLLNRLEVSNFKIYESLKNDSNYEIYINQNLKIIIPYKFGKKVEGMRMRPWPSGIKIDANIPNLKKTFFIHAKQEILDKLQDYKVEYRRRLKFMGKENLNVYIYCNEIYLQRFPSFGYISKSYDVNFIMDLIINK